jgi:hypothetical protein
MKSNRILALFAGVIGLLAIVTLLLVLVSSNKPVKLLSESTPEGVVQGYLLSIDSGEYLKAFNYLSLSPDDKTTNYDMWRQSLGFPSQRPAYKVTLGKSTISGTEASVDVVVDVFRSGGGAFNNPVNTNRVTFILKSIDGAWKITSPTYIWWIY